LGGYDNMDGNSREQLLLEMEALQLKLHKLEDEYRETILKDNKKSNDILESIRDGFMSIDCSWNFLYVNNEAEKIFMKKREQLLGRNLWDLFPEAIDTTIYNEFHRAKNEKKKVHFEHIGLKTKKIYDTIVYPSEFGLSVYFLDITERKLAELEKDQLASIVESSKDAIISASPDGIISSFNHGAELMLTYSASEMINRSILEIVNKDSHELFFEKINKSLGGIDLNYFRTQLIRKDNQKVEVNISIFPIKDSRGITGFSIIARDMSDIIKIKEELRRLDRLNIIGQMSAGVGHEIRNPMTSIRGFLQLLSQKEQYNKDKPFFDLMIQELDRVNLIITELLLLGKAKETDLTESSLEDILNNIKPILLADALRLGMNIDFYFSNVPNINLNEDEIRQLIYNVVRNGLEAMQQGGTIYIRTYMENNHIILSIQDEGNGIDKDTLDKIGTPFFTTKESGTGLGLAICNGIANRNNARLDIKSSPNGTTINVIFKS